MSHTRSTTHQVLRATWWNHAGYIMREVWDTRIRTTKNPRSRNVVTSLCLGGNSSCKRNNFRLGSNPWVFMRLPRSGGLDSNIILILRGGIPRPKGNIPESLSQAILAGIILVGRLGVARAFPTGAGDTTTTTTTTAVLLLKIPEISIDFLDESWVSSWSLEVLNTNFMFCLFEIETLES